MVTLATIPDHYEAPAIQLEERAAVESPIVWWVVLIVVLLALSIFIGVAVVAWCDIHGGGFVVSWTVNAGQGTVRIGCSK